MSIAAFRILLAAAAFAGPLAVGAPAALAHDAFLADDARHGLLIDEPWVMHHWSPFDERAAERALSLQPGQLTAFLYNDHHTIAQLARQRGVGFERLVSELSAWAEDAPGADRAVIEQRVRLMLTGGHLAQHMVGHVFHGLAFTDILTRATDLPVRAFSYRRGHGQTYRGMVRGAGGDPAAVQYALSQAIERNARRGVERGETPASEAERLGARQHGRLHCWFTRPPQIVDVSAPYDRRYTKHDRAHTAADVPTTRGAQARQDASISRGLAGRPPGCWDLPAQFTSDPGDPLSRPELRRLARLPDGWQGKVNDSMDPGHAGHVM